MVQRSIMITQTRLFYCNCYDYSRLITFNIKIHLVKPHNAMWCKFSAIKFHLQTKHNFCIKYYVQKKANHNREKLTIVYTLK